MTTLVCGGYDGATERIVDPTKYSAEIIDKINEKGWNVYAIPRAETASGSLEFIGEGPVTKLEMGKEYAVFPAVENSKDPAHVALAFMSVVKKFGWNLPSMEIDDGKRRIGARFFFGSDGKVCPILGEHSWTEMYPSEYIRSLATLDAITSPKVQQDIKNALR